MEQGNLSLSAAFPAVLVEGGESEQETSVYTVDHGVSEDEVRASASNSYIDCYEGPCVSIHPTTL